MAHISRRDLKKDEVRETLAHGAEALRSHQQATTYVLIAVIILALGIFGWRLYSTRQDVKATAGFDAAMNSYQARVISAGQPPATPSEVTYPDDKTKYMDAAKKFTDVANSYPHTHDGILARYYAALASERIGKDDDAKRLLQQVADSSEDSVAALGRFELAQVEDRTGQGDQAVKLYQQLIDKPSVLVPKPVVMLALGMHYAQQNNDTEAAKVFNQIKADYPDTPIAEQADQSLSMLPGHS